VKTKDHPHLKAKEPAQLHDNTKPDPKLQGKTRSSYSRDASRKQKTAEEISFKGYQERPERPGDQQDGLVA
jgi:hypothetical protein